MVRRQDARVLVGRETGWGYVVGLIEIGICGGDERSEGVFDY